MTEALTLEKLRIDERLRSVEATVARLDERGDARGAQLDRIEKKIDHFPCGKMGKSVEWLTWAVRIVIVGLVGLAFKVFANGH